MKTCKDYNKTIELLMGIRYNIYSLEELIADDEVLKALEEMDGMIDIIDHIVTIITYKEELLNENK